MDGVVVAVTAEVEDERDLVAPVLLRFGARAIDGGEELSAGRLGEHERVLRLHAAKAHDDVADACCVGRGELERTLRSETKLAAGGDEDAHGLGERLARRDEEGRREESGHRSREEPACRGLHGVPSHSTRSEATPSKRFVSRARATASGLPITMVP